MNKMIMLALAASAAFSSSAALAQSASQDSGSYRSLEDQAKAEYQSARSACQTNSGNARQLCIEQAKVARAQAEADATGQYRNTSVNLSKARSKLANAEYDLAKARCSDSSGAAKTTCMDEAKATRTAALADAKAGTTTMAAGTTQGQAGKTAANSENCDALDAAAKAACVTRNAAGTAKVAVTDTVITTKVKADLVKDPDLKAMDVHVETVNGVVMLSGFVPSQAQADKAVGLARGVNGVSDVKNTLKVGQ